MLVNKQKVNLWACQCVCDARVRSGSNYLYKQLWCNLIQTTPLNNVLMRRLEEIGNTHRQTNMPEPTITDMRWDVINGISYLKVVIRALQYRAVNILIISYVVMRHRSNILSSGY